MNRKRVKLPEIIYNPAFLRFVSHYAKDFIKSKGFGKWLKEYQDMEDNEMFEPKALRLQYIKILLGTFDLDYQTKQAVRYICIYAQDAAEKYVEKVVNSLYDIRVITGELAYDEDDDPYTDLSYEEACQIVKALNEEAEEELFIMKKKIYV